MNLMQTYGQSLWTKGWSIVPIKPGTKIPGFSNSGFLPGWQAYCERLATRAEMDSWIRGGSCGIGVALGPASGLVAIDIDVEANAGINAIYEILPKTSAIKRGRAGATLFFRHPSSAGMTKRAINFKTAAGDQVKVDLLWNHAQTVLPPTEYPVPRANQSEYDHIMETGRNWPVAYEWLREPSFNLDDIPMLPENIDRMIDEVLIPLGYKANAQRPAAAQAPLKGAAARKSADRFRDLNDMALANLDAWVPQLADCLPGLMGGNGRYAAVPAWRPSKTGRPIENRKLNLSFTARGITDFGDGPRGYTAIDVVASAKGVTALKAYDWLSDILVPKVIDDTKALMERSIASKAALQAAEESAMLEEQRRQAAARRALADERAEGYKFPTPDLKGVWAAVMSDYTLVGKLTRYAVARQSRPAPLIALGSVLAHLSMLYGRCWHTNVDGLHDTHPNLQVVALAESGVGKSSTQIALNRVFEEASRRRGFIVGVPGGELSLDFWQTVRKLGGFTSQGALEAFIADRPLSLSIVDEFDGIVKDMFDKRASTFHRGMRDFFKIVYTSSSDVYEGKYFSTRERNSQRGRPIMNPSFTMLGLATPTAFWKAMSEDAWADGFLGRTILVPGDADVYAGEMQRFSIGADEYHETDWAGARRFHASEEALQDLVNDVHRALMARNRICSGHGNVAGSADNLANEKPHLFNVPIDMRGWYKQSPDDDCEEFDIAETEFQMAMEKYAEQGRLARTYERIDAPIWSRAGEQVVKLALIHALARDPDNPMIFGPDIWFADKVVWNCMLAAAIEANSATNGEGDNPQFAATVRAIERMVRMSTSGITKPAAARQIKVPNQALDAAVDHLILAGKLVMVPTPNGRGHYMKWIEGNNT